VSTITRATFRGRCARTGVQLYAAGPEHRDASAVFEPASLATLNNLRVQVGHEATAPQVGYVQADSHGRERGPDGNEYLTAVLVITDAATIADLRAGKIAGISMGYSTEHVTDAAGRKHQTQIRHEHLALLRAGRETPRCGAHCAITTKDSMPQRTTDSLPLTTDATAACGCSADEQAQRDRIDAWLDIASDRTGVHKANIVAALSMRSDAATQQLTREVILDTASELTTPATIARANMPAQYHNGLRQPAGRADAVNGSDDAFRKQLSAKLRADQSDATDDGVTQDAGNGSDAAFSAALARKVAAQ
jgi:hypothetical protein